MLIRPAALERIAAGEIDLAFRRWKRPSVKAGGTLRTAVGVLAIEAVERVEEGQLGEDDAHRAGASSLAELLDELSRRPPAPLYRVRLRFAGPDPRVVLRERDDLTEDDVAAIAARLARLDRASPRGPWTEETLALVAAQPAVRAPDLAESLGRDTLTFKRDVRKLKELGLTISLHVGYELSPRGRAYLRRAPG